MSEPPVMPTCVFIGGQLVMIRDIETMARADMTSDALPLITMAGNLGVVERHPDRRVQSIIEQALAHPEAFLARQVR